MRAFPLYLALALLLPHCGGGSGSAEPKTAANEDSEGSEESSTSGSTEDADEGESTASTEKARGPSCDDGTCSVCGSGICPSGWYCDEAAPGGAACAWLKECADKPTCGCVSKVIGPSCKCRDDSGIKVSCN